MDKMSQLLATTLLSLPALCRLPLSLRFYLSKNKVTQPNCTKSMSTSVVVSAYNEENTMSEVITSILASDIKLNEVIIIDDCSSDKTYEEILPFEDKVHIIRNETNLGKTNSINKALNLVTGENIVFLDADTTIEKSSIRTLIGEMNRKGSQAICGHLKVKNKTNTLTRLQSEEYKMMQNYIRRIPANFGSLMMLTGAFFAIKKETLLKSNGLSTDTVCEDMDLAYSVLSNNENVTISQKAFAYTKVPETLKKLITQRFRWSLGSFQVLRKYRNVNSSSDKLKIFSMKYNSLLSISDNFTPLITIAGLILIHTVFTLSFKEFLLCYLVSLGISFIIDQITYGLHGIKKKLSFKEIYINFYTLFLYFFVSLYLIKQLFFKIDSWKEWKKVKHPYKTSKI